MRAHHARRIAATLLLSATLLLPVTADAQTLDNIAQVFVARAAGIERATGAAAQQIFLSLVCIDLVWIVGWTAVSTGEIAAVLAAATRTLLAASFFYWLLLNGAVFGNAIIDGLAMLGGQAAQTVGGLQTLGPTDVFNSGVRIVAVLYDLIGTMSISGIPLAILYCIAGTIVLVIFAWLAAMLLEVIIESAIMAYIGIILLAFGATAYTRDMAIAYLRFCFAIGMKRLVLQVIVGIGTGTVAQLAFNLHTGLVPPTQTIALIVAIPLVLYHLAHKLPYRIQDVINGQVSHAGGGLFSAATGAAGAALGFGAGAVSAHLAGQANAGAVAAQGGGAGAQTGAYARGALGHVSGVRPPLGWGGSVSPPPDLGQRLNSTRRVQPAAPPPPPEAEA